MTSHFSSYGKGKLIEQPSIELFEELGWEVENCFYETFGPSGTLGRETTDYFYKSFAECGIHSLEKSTEVDNMNTRGQNIWVGNQS